jgi:hypothetical protein
MWGKKKTLAYFQWECELVQPLWKSVQRFLEELKIQLSYDPEILHAMSMSKRHLYSRVHCIIIHNRDTEST